MHSQQAKRKYTRLHKFSAHLHVQHGRALHQIARTEVDRAGLLIKSVDLGEGDAHRVGSVWRASGEHTQLLFQHRKSDLGIEGASGAEILGLLESVGVQVKLEGDPHVGEGVQADEGLRGDVAGELDGGTTRRCQQALSGRADALSVARVDLSDRLDKESLVGVELDV